MERLVLVAVGEVALARLECLHATLPGILGRPCRIDPHQYDPAPAANHPRRQYDAGILVEGLAARASGERERVLGVTGLDLYLSVFTFVIGAAHLGGRAGVVSVHRLEFGTASSLRDERLVKEAVHECGHLLGAAHCATPDCVMHFSAVPEEIDLKSKWPCPECARGMGIPPGIFGDQGA